MPELYGQAERCLGHVAVDSDKETDDVVLLYVEGTVIVCFCVDTGERAM